ncbi:T9SS type A sorting domain-containing protein [Flavivirga aquimarina]|uniref:T9SS type A sorting domain-containing protein n=1 Tax=Flavivirga aquimarina TaxID=2027862 RepID=A0ABT8WAD5_9FLAO|nr:T9SS type A sorting domain-containing protein [Flavivirga aquimarina]MDO5970027.1 T9SS type A sorting domain-containing protein [Flavivirga aquimarina]
MKIKIPFFTKKINIISILFFLILILHSIPAQEINTLEVLPEFIPENNFQTHGLSVNIDGTYTLKDATISFIKSMSEIDNDNDNVENTIDLDDDNDGILDTAENNLGVDPSADADMDGIPNYQDFDNNSSTTAPVCIDADLDDICDTLDPVFDFDGDGVPNHYDLDSDNDGIYDVIEAGGTPNSVNFGQANDTDGDSTNNSGVPNSANGGAGNIPIDTLSDGSFDFQNTDSDVDGCSDANEAYGLSTADGGDTGVFGDDTLITVDPVTGIVTTAGSGIDYTITPLDGDINSTADYLEVGPDADVDGIPNACDELGVPLSVTQKEVTGSSILIYPIPTSEYINISSNITIKTIELVNSLGKRVLTTQKTNQIRVDQLQRGLYFIKLDTNKGKLVKKVIVE